MHANVALGRRSDSSRLRRTYGAARYFALVGALLLVAACDDAGNRTAADFIESGVEHLEAGRAPAAAIQLKNAVQQAPQDPVARLQLARAYLALEALAAAEKELEAAITRGDETEETRVLLARTKGNMGKHDEVLRFVETHGDFEGEQASRNYQVIKALAYHAEGVETTAETLLTRVLDDGPHADALAARARMARQAGQLDEALSYLDEALEEDPDHVEALLSKGQILLASGEAEESVEILSRAYELSRYSPRIQLTLAKAHTFAGNHDEARQLVERLEKVAPRNPQLRYLQAYLALAGQDYELARTIADELLGDAPRYGPALAVAGIANLHLEHLELAREHFNKHLAENPDNMSVRILLAWVMAQQGSIARGQELLDFNAATADVDLVRAAAIARSVGLLDRAAEFLRIHVARNPGDTQARSQLAALDFYQDRPESAAGHLKILIQQKPDEADVVLRLAEVLLYLDRPDEALELLAPLKEESVNNEIYLTLLGQANYRLGDTAAAITALKSALEKAPNATVAALSLARIHQDEGDGEAASTVLERTLEADPGSEIVRTALVDLSVERGNIAYSATLVDEGLRLNPGSEQMQGLRDQIECCTVTETEYAAAGEPLGLEIAATPAIETTIAASSHDQAPVADTADDWHARVLLLFQEGRYVEALEAAERFTELYPREARAHNDLGLALMGMNKFNEALAAYRTSLEIDPANQTAALNLANALVQVEKQSEARDVLRSAIKFGGVNERIYLKLAEIETRLGNGGEAGRLLQEGISRLPESIDLKIALGRHYLVRNRAQETEDLLASELAERPSHWLLLDTLARAYTTTGRTTEAAELFARMAELEGDSAGARLLAARAHVHAGQPDAAVNQLTAALALSPDNLESRLLLAELLVSLGQLPQASAHIEKLLEQAPTNGQVIVIHGRYLVAVEDLPGALQAFRRAVELEPDTQRVLLLAQALWENGESSAAKATVEQWLEENTTDYDAIRLLAGFHLQESEYAKAVPLIERLIEAAPGSEQLLRDYVSALFLSGQAENALRVASKARQDNPDSPILQGTLGWIHLEQGRTDEALPLLHDATLAAPDDAAILINYARALVEVRDIPAATRALESARQLELSDEQRALVAELEDRI